MVNCKYCGRSGSALTGISLAPVSGPRPTRPGARDCFLSRLSIVTNEVVFDALQFVIDINIIVNTSPAPGHPSRLSLNCQNLSETQSCSHSHHPSSLYDGIPSIY